MFVKGVPTLGSYKDCLDPGHQGSRKSLFDSHNPTPTVGGVLLVGLIGKEPDILLVSQNVVRPPILVEIVLATKEIFFFHKPQFFQICICESIVRWGNQYTWL